MSTMAWIILGIVVLVILAVLAFFLMNRRAGARRARAEQIRQEAAQRAAELDRKEAEANAMAAQAQDARAEADRLASVSTEQREETAAARTEVEDSLRKADRLDPDVGDRTGNEADASPRRATEGASAGAGVRDRTVDDDSVRDASVRDDSVRDDSVRDASVRDESVRDEQASSTRLDVDNNTARDDLHRADDTGNRGTADERSTDPRR